MTGDASHSNMGHDRTAHLVKTGENRFEASFIPPENPSSYYKNESNGGTNSPPNSNISNGFAKDQTADDLLYGGTRSRPNSSISSGFVEDQAADDLIYGCQDDPLKPSAEDIERTFWRGKTQWRECLGLAERLQNPSIPESPGVLRLTQGVPPLPSQLLNLKEMKIRGYPMWEFKRSEPDDMQSSITQMDDISQLGSPATMDGSDPTWQPTSPPEVDEWNEDLIRGNEKEFRLSIPKPTSFTLLKECKSKVDTSPASPSNGITILIQCLSYYFCANLLEMQGREVKFTSQALSTNHLGCSDNDKIILDLRCASQDLVCWLSILLAPKLRWTKPIPPWALVYEGVNRLYILTSPTYSSPEWATSPSSKKAASLISELCVLFGLDDQLDAAVSAIIMLPFYNYRKLAATLPVPILLKRNCPKHAHDPFRQYSEQISQLMTISIGPRLIGSSLWSVFWEADVDCNVVSAWLSSIHEVIKPVLESRDTELLIRIFMLYRPQQAPLWMGVLWLGSSDWAGMVESYLATLSEQPKFIRASQPDSVTAAWLGCKQSFLDEVGLGCYEENGTRMLSNSDLARVRFNYRYLANPEELPYGWQPFGSVSAKEIEPELHQYLDLWRARKYHGWFWIVGDEKRPFHSHVIDNKQAQETPNIERTNGTIQNLPPIDSYPSREATSRVLTWALRDACGDRMNLPRLPESHPWSSDY
ncbi:hypothetical protein V495_08592 [Pseudogymnoascus sp. VKM F-4514 (FW-929)]|nr:hypothetical protein V495_08592 [Pseudogymnoascus sp. VKM F-4514 (FW-929)]KFY66720.1 hypothetical protein V497_00740 [Pseudogymnoascus sp. VKM F-4516 (FW-969)]